MDTDTVVSSATGFVYQRGGKHFLITNWHVVTGTNPETAAVSAIPTAISTMFRTKGKPGLCVRETLSLYVDTDANNDPLWLEHPVHRKRVDVVALPLAQSLLDRYDLFPINALHFDQTATEVADDAFVIGYPFFETPYLHFPIWKRASIASEPTVDVDQLPKLFVDTATRPGMSGSPVIVTRSGIHGIEGGKPTSSTTIGTIRWFLGVYSGRKGVDELNAQLGIVWKARIIDDLLESEVIGAP
ncbi:MAG TPA: trypsin-like peptidase domain-containing protein [Chthoniobacterales bacterium]